MIADVILLTGAPGVGKSTTARRLAPTYQRAVHLHTDDFWRVIVSGGIAPYLPESHDQNQIVMTAIQRTAVTYATGGFTTIVDGIIGPWMLPHFQQPSAQREGATPRLHYIVMRPSRSETLRRAQARTSPDALVAADPVTAMWDQFADLGAFEPHVIDSTNHRPEETLAAVQRAIASGAYLLRT